MWKLLTQNDIEQARRELGRRRAELLKRQGEELEALNSDRAEIQALEELVKAFAERFKPTRARAPEIALAEQAADPVIEVRPITKPPTAQTATNTSADSVLEDQVEPTPAAPEIIVAKEAAEPAIESQAPTQPPASETVTENAADPVIENGVKPTPEAAEIAVARQSDHPVPQPPPTAEKPRARAAQSERRNYSGTNFELFSRAVRKSAF
jgi:hypothetical protein